MKIALISTFPDYKGGVAEYTGKLTQELEKRPEIEIVKIGEGCEADIQINLSSRREIVSAVEQVSGVDVLHYQHTGGIFGKLQGATLPVFEHCRNVVTLHEPDADCPYSLYSVNTRIQSFAQRSLLNKMDAVIVHTRHNRERLEERYGAENISVVPHGLTSKIQEPENQDVKNVLFFGLISGNKNLELVKKVAEQHTDKKFIVAGNGELKVDFSGLNNVEVQNSWIPNQKKHELFQWSDAGLLPYKSQNSASGVLCDAVSYGKPVVATNLPVFRELVEDTGLGVCSGGEGFSDALDSLDKNYQNFTEACKRKSSDWTWCKSASQHLNLYQKDGFLNSLERFGVGGHKEHWAVANGGEGN